MSLQKIGKYIEIYEKCDAVRQPTKEDTRRIALIQHIAIAGLIDAGAPYEVENGEIIIDTGIGYKSVFINDVYPYLSLQGQNKVIMENSRTNQLPPPTQYQNQNDQMNTQYNQYSSYQTNYNYQTEQQDYQNYSQQDYQQQSYQQQDYQQQPTETYQQETTTDTTYQTEASREYERKQNPEKVMMEGLEDYNADSVNEDDNNFADLEYIRGFDEQGNELNQDTQNYSNDIQALNKDQLTYERCQLEVRGADGTTMRFTVHSAPLTEADDGRIITRFKLLGKNANYVHTEHGRQLEFALATQTALINIYVEREMRPDGVFSCRFFSDDPSLYINKIGVIHGGTQGNPVIYDNNLEVRIYPFPNRRNNETGEMEFGNNNKGEAAFLYYINNNGNEFSSSISEQAPYFSYDGSNYMVMARWDNDTIRVTAETMEQ